ncbi:MAG: hypothetical protein ACLU0O_08165 [Collinsella sp.]
MSGDADFMAAKVADGIDVHIVMRNPTTANASVVPGHCLYSMPLAVMERAADSQIVQEHRPPRDGCLYWQNLR